MRRATPTSLALAAMLALASPVSAATCDASSNPTDAARFLVLAEGDSITFGQGASDGRSFVQRACLPKGTQAIDTARSQSTLGSPTDGPAVNSLYGRLEDDARLIFDKRAGRKVVLTVLIGRNDLVGYGGGAMAYADDLSRYITAMRAAGVDRVVVGTLLPSDWAPFTTVRAAFDAILRGPGWGKAHGVDAIADYAASPVMGSDAAATDKMLFVDGIHPTDHGYDLLAPVFSKAVKAAMQAGKTH